MLSDPNLYATLRQFMLPAGVLMFVGICVYAFWPGRRKAMDDAARIPLLDDDRKD